MTILRAVLGIVVVMSAAGAQSMAEPSVPLSSGTLPAPTGAPSMVTGTPMIVCDANCIRSNADRAVQACAPRIEAEAPGDYDWLIRPYGSIFQEADSPEQTTSVVARYRGDSIRFLSPQKEWVRAIYECGYDTTKQEVSYLKVKLGVLGKANAVPVLLTPSPALQARAPAVGSKQPASRPQTATAAQPSAPTVDRRRVGEPNDVSVLQIKSPPGAR